MPVAPATGEAEVGRLWFQASQGKLARDPTEKQTKSKSTQGMAQICKALSSIPSTTKRKKKKKT
jgi:hypothetical protein